jgi:hypothetical protein
MMSSVASALAGRGLLKRKRKKTSRTIMTVKNINMKPVMMIRILSNQAKSACIPPDELFISLDSIACLLGIPSPYFSRAAFLPAERVGGKNARLPILFSSWRGT